MQSSSTLASSPRRNAATTKARILTAAQRAFAELGYSQAGIRHIAAEAGVDSALVPRYFGSKIALFEAALSAAIPDFATLGEARADIASSLTAHLTTFFDLSAQSMIALSTNDAEARVISASVLKVRVLTPMVQWLGPPNAEARAIQLVMLATGFTLFTQQVPLISSQDLIASGTVQWLSERLEEIVGQPDPAATVSTGMS